MSNALPVLTEEDIERLEPSRTLDATVAHDVLHCRPSMSDYEHRLEAFCDCSDSRHEQACSYVERMLARYSTNLEAAWGVIEYLIRDDFRINLTHDDAGWRCVFETRLIDGTTGHYESGQTPTAPLAICRAALKASKAE